MQNYCAIIDTIIYNYQNKLSNTYMMEHLHTLYKATGIGNQSMSTIAGSIYESDSLFYDDMRRYRTALKCAGKR